MCVKVFFIFISSISCLGFAAETSKNDSEKNTLLDVVDVAGTLTTMTLDATVGELLVRAYPRRVITNQSFSDVPATIELSCDTYRTGSANHYIAAATACHVQFSFDAANASYSLKGPFRNVESFQGQSCEAARDYCAAYTLTLKQINKKVELWNKEKRIGTLDFSALTPSYTLN